MHITLFVHFLAVTARLRSTISRYTEDVNKRRRNFNVVEIHQPGLMGLLSSQNLGLIKVVMTAKAEREETTTDDSSQTTKTSQELKAEVFHKCAQVFTGLGRLEKPYHIEIDRVSPLISGCQ